MSDEKHEAAIKAGHIESLNLAMRSLATLKAERDKLAADLNTVTVERNRAAKQISNNTKALDQAHARIVGLEGDFNGLQATHDKQFSDVQYEGKALLNAALSTADKLRFELDAAVAHGKTLTATIIDGKRLDKLVAELGEIVERVRGDA